MGILSALSSSLFHVTTDGRRICQLRSLIPGLPSPVYLVADGDVERVGRRFRRVTAFFFGVIVLGVQFTPPLPDSLTAASWPRLVETLILLALPGVALYWVIRLWVLHGLERVRVGKADFPPVRWRAQFLYQARATGVPTLSLLLAAGILMTAGQVWMAITHGVWWAYVGSVLFTVGMLVMAWQLVMLLRDGRADEPTEQARF